MDRLDEKLIELFDGKLVRKDLLQRIKKGTNVPTFVLEFLLARYCASDDEDEIQAGLEAVLETLSDNYVRPDESNAAQSKVATKGKHKFIDKVHVRYVESQKRHWASLENFNSQKIAVGEKFYKENKRLLEGGIWAEVKLAFNEIEEDDYAFYIEEFERDNQAWVRFGLHPNRDSRRQHVDCEAPIKDRRDVTDSGGHSENRYVIDTTFALAGKKILAEVTLTNRDNMRYRLLLGRNALRRRFLVDPGRSYLLGKEPQPALTSNILM